MPSNTSAGVVRSPVKMPLKTSTKQSTILKTTVSFYETAAHEFRNKFELLERSRQFRSLLQKSSCGSAVSGDLSAGRTGAETDCDSEDLTASGLEPDRESGAGKRAPGQQAANELEAGGQGALGQPGGGGGGGRQPDGGPNKRQPGDKSVRIRLSKLGALGRVLDPLLRLAKGRPGARSRPSRRHLSKRRKSNKVSSIMVNSGVGETIDSAADGALAEQGAESVALDSGEQPTQARAHASASASSTGDAKKGTNSSLMSRLFSRAGN